MARSAKVGPIAAAAGEAATRLGPDALAALLVPSLDEAARRAHGVLGHAADAAHGVLAEAERRAARAAADLERRTRRASSHAADELRDVVREVDGRVAERIRDARRSAESVLDSFLDRVLALGLAFTLAYGGYLLARSRGGPVDVLHVAVLVWMGMTFFAVVIGLAWRLTARPERLRHTLVWFLYIAALGGIATVVLLVLSRVPVF